MRSSQVVLDRVEIAFDDERAGEHQMTSLPPVNGCLPNSSPG
jgi:hypothetical protein